MDGLLDPVQLIIVVLIVGLILVAGRAWKVTGNK